jgi:protein-S-isoprenylcysteine O-methyltransferase Ste14
MRAVLRAVLFPLTIFAVVTSCWRLDAWFGWSGVHLPAVGAPLALVGLALIVWCNVLFLELGRGTAHPFAAKTQKLVIAGPYRYVRNPMMWGVGSLLAGSALWLGSAGLWVALGFFLTFILLFVPLYEERDMERRFGEAYRDYCRRVPRWLPRLPR